jgi:hypothetical protein
MKTTSYAAALLAALCFSTTVLAAVPVGAASDPTTAVSASASSNEAASSSDQSDDTTASETSESSKTSDSTSTEASTSTDTDEQAKGATTDTEADVTQTIEIHQVISKTATKAASVADTKYTGVNGATWSVYDVTSELTSLLSGQKDAKDLKSATDQLESALTKKSYDVSKYNKIKTGKTATINNVDGLFDVPVTTKAHAYKALLFQNDAVPAYTTKASQFVLIVPLADDAGKIPSKMVIQPKSETLPKPKAKTPTGVFPQTGDKVSKGATIAGVFLAISALGTWAVSKAASRLKKGA